MINECIHGGLLNNLGSFLYSYEILRLSHLNRRFRQVIWKDVFGLSVAEKEGKSQEVLQREKKEYYKNFEREDEQREESSQVDAGQLGSERDSTDLPLSYASILMGDGKLVWSSAGNRHQNRRGHSLAHVVFDGQFTRMPRYLRMALLYGLNHVQTLRVEGGYFMCSCPACSAQTTDVPESALPGKVSAEDSTQQPYGEVHGEAHGESDDLSTTAQDAPAVFAAFTLPQSNASPQRAPADDFGDYSSGEDERQANLGAASSRDPGLIRQAGDTTESDAGSPLVATVQYDHNECSSIRRDSLAEPPTRYPAREGHWQAVLKRTQRRHAFERLIVIFQIIYRNRHTLKSAKIDGPPREASTSLIRDEELFKLPFPMRQRAQSTPAVQPEVGSSILSNCEVESSRDALTAGIGDAGSDLSPTDSESAGKQKANKSKPAIASTVIFQKLEEIYFGSTVDCRYIVPFLDYSDFCCLRSVGVGRLTARYVKSAPQFGEKATVIFAPQHIFNQLSFPCAPHLPAVYNGSIDENLRFQGRGIFVCDEYTYEGEFKDGVNHGLGHMRSKAGEEYQGNWKHGQRNGIGRVVQITGDSLEGEWINDSLCGVGLLQTADHFRYHGQWSASRFHGWGLLYYRNCLVAYGLFTRGFFSQWSRSVRFQVGTNSASSGLGWEEAQHDEYGRVTRCFQVSLTLPHTNPITGEYSRITVSRLGMENPEKTVDWIRNLDLSLLRSPCRNHFNHSDSSRNAKHRELSTFRHHFPDDESPYHSDFERNCLHIEMSESAEFPILTMSSPMVASRTSTSEVICSSPVRRANVSTPLSRCVPREARSGNSFAPADKTPALQSSSACLPRSHSWSRSFHSLSSSLHVEDSEISGSAQPFSPGLGDVNVGADQSVRANIHREAQVFEAPDMIAFPPSLELPSPAERNPNGPDEDLIESGGQEVLGFALALEGQGGDRPAEGARQPPPSGGDTPAVASTEIQRSRAALLQAMETVEKVLKSLDNDEQKATEYWSAFHEWNGTFFRRIHCDWVQPPSVRKRMNELKLTSPLTVPSSDEVPAWFKRELLADFKMNYEP